MIEARHIQNMSEAATLEPHWGYADRALPCTNDPGSCAYLDLVYHAHDLGMIYSGVMWCVIAGILVIWAVARRMSPSSPPRLFRAAATSVRHHLGREVRRLRFVFGRVSRLQLVVLAGLAAYLAIFSFVGMTYQTWVTPIKNSTKHNVRTSLGPFSDRIGLLAYALTPLSVLLGARESVLSVLTGVPYQHFNFLHRWVGHIILLQSVVHTITWCVVELRLYQPQPTVGIEWIKQLYMIWGVVAMFLLVVLWALATPWAMRAFGYEFFRKTHYVLAMLYIGACWGHWANLKCFMLPSLLLWGLDRIIRLARTALLHYRFIAPGSCAFTPFPARVTHFDEDVVRLDIDLHKPMSWAIGQHFFLTFTRGSIWQSHPFTPLSLPGSKQAYVLRAKRGETAKLVQWTDPMTPVIFTGPYGVDITRDLVPMTNVLCIAGGTGITYVLPVILERARQGLDGNVGGFTQLVWAVRHQRDTEWVAEELDEIRRCPNVSVVVYTTRDGHVGSEPSSIGTASGNGQGKLDPDSEKGFHTESTGTGRPNLPATLGRFLSNAIGKSRVYVSGPPSMVTDARDAVAQCNSGSRVWKGDDKYDVEVVCDERFE